MLYRLAIKFGGGKVGKIWQISMIDQIKTIQKKLVLTINNLLADLFIRQIFLPNAQKK